MPDIICTGEDKQWQDEQDCENRYCQAAHCADGQRKPEGFFALADYERYETENGRHDGQKYRDYLDAEGTQVGFQRSYVRISGAQRIVFVEDVYCGIDGDACKQDERCKSALVKVKSEKIERGKDSDEWHRDYEDYGEGLA